MNKIPLAKHPAAPWGNAESPESHARYVDSLKKGHRHAFFKCNNCSLEFMLMSWRTEIELLEYWKPQLGAKGGACVTILCPECRTLSNCFLIKIVNWPGPIYGFVGLEPSELKIPVVRDPATEMLERLKKDFGADKKRE